MLTIVEGKLIVQFSVTFPKINVENLTVKEYKDRQSAIEGVLRMAMEKSSAEWNASTQKALDEIYPGSTFTGKVLVNTMMDSNAKSMKE
jgi:hypothetical protein